MKLLELECLLYTLRTKHPSHKTFTSFHKIPRNNRGTKTNEYTQMKPDCGKESDLPFLPPQYSNAIEYASLISSRLAKYRASSAKSVLIFEKDENFASLLKDEGFSLENSFKVTIATDSSRPLEKIRLLKPELLIIEPDISPVDGWTIIKMLKSNKHLSNLPIILMSAKYNTPSDIIAGLEHFGADDYLVKPFPTRILVARAKAVLRRAQNTQNSDNNNDITNFNTLFNDDPDAIKLSGIAISPLHRKVIIKDNRKAAIEAHLTPQEFSILYFMMKHKDRAISRDEIIYAVYDSERDDIFSRVIDRHISEIRRKLKDDGSIIKTVFRSGYMFSSTRPVGNNPKSVLLNNRPSKNN